MKGARKERRIPELLLKRGKRMTKVIGMLVALAVFAAMPAVAFAGDVSSGNTQDGEINQGASGGDSTANGGDGGSGGSGGDASSGDGGDAGNQGAIVQQNAGDDANASINQEQNFGGGGGDGDDDGDDGDHDGDGDDSDHDGDDDDVSGGDDDHDGVGGGSESVELAETGFDAWILALVGGLALAGGLGILVAQRRGRLSA
jgi:LPXTG-motif cell wall-anchored protein